MEDSFFWKEEVLPASFPQVNAIVQLVISSTDLVISLCRRLIYLGFLVFNKQPHTTEMFPIWLTRIAMGRHPFSVVRYGKYPLRNGDHIVYSCCRDQSAMWWARTTYGLQADNKSCHSFGKNSLDISPITLQNSKQFFLLSADRFQAHAVNNLRIIFLIWNIVSGVLQKFSMEDKYSQELNDFLLGNQKFSIKEFTRKNGFYLNSSTLLECDFFGKPCYPQVNMFILLKQ